MQKNLRHCKGLLRQGLRVAVQRVLAEKNIDSGWWEISKLLNEGVDTMTCRHNMLVAHKCTPTTGCSNSGSNMRLSKENIHTFLIKAKNP